MYARKKIVEVQVVASPELRSRLTQGHNPEEKTAMLKDLHLIEAALAAASIVVSADENARALFQIREFSAITWVNPVSDKDRVQAWLEVGAPQVDEWKLGYQA